MQVRATTFRRGNKTYQYAQLVESYRRKSDGVPLHRVIANLGRITDPLQLENLKAAFAANRSGQRLAPVVAMTAEPTTETARLRRPQAILRYLDVAVVVEMMRTLGLTEEIARLLPKEETEGELHRAGPAGNSCPGGERLDARTGEANQPQTEQVCRGQGSDSLGPDF